MRTRIRLYNPIAFLCILAFLAVACSRSAEEKQLQEALRFAGDNRSQFEKVLAYYADDSLRLAAARFLIANMPGHYSFSPEDTACVTSYSHQVRDLCERMRGQEAGVIRDSINACASRCGITKLNKAFDCSFLTADYLIRNIDEAFRSWKQGRWARNLSFEEFCEFLLPYKVEELQLTDDWRTRLHGFQCQRLDQLDWCDQYCRSPLAAAKIVNANLFEYMHPDHAANVEFMHMKIEDAVCMPFGTCDFYVMVATVVMRSQGIPVARDFTPHWAYRNIGHSWNVVLTSEGKEVPFTGVCTQPGEEHKPDEKMPKTYRCTYAANQELQRLNRKEKYVPRLFRNVFIKDVSSHYMKCRDVTLSVKTKHSSYAYLTVYDQNGWAPVAVAEIKHGKARFRDMGCNVLYLPVSYKADGTEEILGSPFVLESDGTMRLLNETNKQQNITVRRKYPTLDYVYVNMERMLGGEFQASNDPNFSSYTTVHKIKDGHAYGYEIHLPDSLRAYRYWRYIQDKPASFCNMAEMGFIAPGENTPMKGTVIGTPGSWKGRGGQRESVFDGDALTFFDAPEPQSSWVGMDFGKPVRVERIYYVARGDGNTIEPGDIYQISCWRNNRWEPLATMQAEHPWLEFRNMPCGLPFILQDKTRGKDMRIFTYEDGKQVWW